jgi:hypothetical protein
MEFLGDLVWRECLDRVRSGIWKIGVAFIVKIFCCCLLGGEMIGVSFLSPSFPLLFHIGNNLFRWYIILVVFLNLPTLPMITRTERATRHKSPIDVSTKSTFEMGKNVVILMLSLFSSFSLLSIHMDYAISVMAWTTAMKKAAYALN